MAKGKKVQIVFSDVLHGRIAVYAERSGLTINQSITAILNNALQLNGNTTASDAPSKTPISTLRANLKNAQNKVVARREEHELMQRKRITITPEQFEELYDLMWNAAELKHQLGEGDHPDEVMKRNYNNTLYRLNSGFEYDTMQMENNQMTDEGVRQYNETRDHINVLKDRLK